MKTCQVRLIAIACAFLGGVAPSLSQTVVPDTCKFPNSTAIFVTMANGSIVQLHLEREGDRIQGMAFAGQAKGTVKGQFSGQQILWDVTWEDGSRASFRGQLRSGEGTGTAFHSELKDSVINWTARSAEGCSRWPDGQIAKPAREGAPEQPAKAAVVEPRRQIPTTSPSKTKKQKSTRLSASPRRCPAGATLTASGECVKPIGSQVPFIPLPLIGGGFSIQFGR